MELEQYLNNIFTERNILYTISAALIVTTIIDLYTAYTSPIFKIAESNPIYLTYGLLPLTIANIIVLGIFMFGIKKTLKLTMIFVFVLGSIFLSYGHLIGANSNIEATKIYEKNPEVVTTYLQTMTKEQKIAGYTDLVLNRLLYPYMLVVIAFALTMIIFEQRKPQRQKYIDEGIKLLLKGKET